LIKAVKSEVMALVLESVNVAITPVPGTPTVALVSCNVGLLSTSPPGEGGDPGWPPGGGGGGGGGGWASRVTTTVPAAFKSVGLYDGGGQANSEIATEAVKEPLSS
jgi:hypothetical protein